jgi:arginase family enzyme
VDLPNRPIYIHFDSDVLPLSALSAVSYPAEGGASLETIEASLAHLADTGSIVAISVTMWNPELDDEARTAEQVVMGLVDRLVERVQAG